MRLAEPSEAPLLVELNLRLAEDVDHRRPLPEPAFYERRMRELLSDGHLAMLFFEGDDPSPAAYALYLDRGAEIYLRQFWVRRDCRRRGVGRAAMRMLIDSWPPDRALTVDTFAGNSAAIAFWRSVGYRDYQLVLRMEAGERQA